VIRLSANIQRHNNPINAYSIAAIGQLNICSTAVPEIRSASVLLGLVAQSIPPA
jgi:hypothetical protein